MVLDLIHVLNKWNSPKNSTHNLSFEAYMQVFQILWHVLFCHKYIPYIQVFHYFLNLKKKKD
jgi:hypothetical protein